MGLFGFAESGVGMEPEGKEEESRIWGSKLNAELAAKLFNGEVGPSEDSGGGRGRLVRSFGAGRTSFASWRKVSEAEGCRWFCRREAQDGTEI